MGTGEKDEVGRLFADITAHLEDAHEFAVAGQNPRQTSGSRKARASEIKRHARIIDEALTQIEHMLNNSPD